MGMKSEEPVDMQIVIVGREILHFHPAPRAAAAGPQATLAVARSYST